MAVVPWSGWPAVGANEIAGVHDDDEARTAIIDPDAWWAAVRAALRTINEWAPDIVAAWADYHDATKHCQSLTWGPGTHPPHRDVG